MCHDIFNTAYHWRRIPREEKDIHDPGKISPNVEAVVFGVLSGFADKR
jgi:hypothetical protein